MDHKVIIHTMIAVYATLIKENKEPEKAEKIDNGERFTWELGPEMNYVVDQLDEPEDMIYSVQCPDFTLTLYEDVENQKYKLDAPEIKNEEKLSLWLSGMYMRCKENVEGFETLGPTGDRPKM